MSRLIDADAVPQEFWEYEFDGKWRGCTIKDLLDSQPTIQPEPHWIPVTERLPEVGKSVLICDAYGDICLGHRANYGYYFPDFCGDKIKDVRAWCELPEPYKGVTE